MFVLGRDVTVDVLFLHSFLARGYQHVPVDVKSHYIRGSPDGILLLPLWEGHCIEIVKFDSLNLGILCLQRFLK